MKKLIISLGLLFCGSIGLTTAQYSAETEKAVDQFVELYHNASEGKQEIVRERIIEKLGVIENQFILDFLTYLTGKLLKIDGNFIFGIEYNQNNRTDPCEGSTNRIECNKIRIIPVSEACGLSDGMHDYYLEYNDEKSGFGILKMNNIIYYTAIETESADSGFILNAIFHFSSFDCDNNQVREIKSDVNSGTVYAQARVIGIIEDILVVEYLPYGHAIASIKYGIHTKNGYSDLSKSHFGEGP